MKKMNSNSETRAAALAQARTLAETAKAEGRALTADESQRFDGLMAEVRTATAIASADQARANLFATSRRTSDALAGGKWLANEIRTLVPGSGSGTAIDGTSYANFALETLALESTFLRSGVNQITIGDGLGQSLTIPTITADTTTYNLAAGSAITASDPTIAATVATPAKFASLLNISNEVLFDANPAVFQSVSTSLVKSIATAFDLAAFTGSGTAPAITGLQNVASIGTVSMGTNGASLSSLDQFAEAIGAVVAAGGRPSAIVVGARTYLAMLKLKTLTSGANMPLLLDGGAQDGAGAALPPSIYGVPLYVSGNLPANETQGTATTAQSAYVYDAAQVHAVFRRARGNTSSLVSLERDSSALFGSDITQLRGILRATIAVPYAGAVCRIKGILA
jgi:HK97 family phage major capsid protein